MTFKIIKRVVIAAVAIGSFSLAGCGGENTAPESAEESLTPSEEQALNDEYELEAIEKIDETNAEAEAEKLAQEIQADQ